MKNKNECFDSVYNKVDAANVELKSIISDLSLLNRNEPVNTAYNYIVGELDLKELKPVPETFNLDKFNEIMNEAIK